MLPCHCISFSAMSNKKDEGERMRPWPLSTYTEVSTFWWGCLLPRGS